MVRMPGSLRIRVSNAASEYVSGIGNGWMIWDLPALVTRASIRGYLLETSAKAFSILALSSMSDWMG
jgi:hypothetical protein